MIVRKLSEYFVQLKNLLPRVLKTFAIVDRKVGDRQSLFAAGLCGKDATCLFDGLCVSSQQSLDLQFFAAIDGKNAVDEAGAAVNRPAAERR